MNYFKLLDLGEGLQEAEIVEWHISVGDEVKQDQTLVSVEKDWRLSRKPSRIAQFRLKPTTSGLQMAVR